MHSLTNTFLRSTFATNIDNPNEAKDEPTLSPGFVRNFDLRDPALALPELRNDKDPFELFVANSSTPVGIDALNKFDLNNEKNQELLAVATAGAVIVGIVSASAEDARLEAEKAQKIQDKLGLSDEAKALLNEHDLTNMSIGAMITLALEIEKDLKEQQDPLDSVA